jgi:predicted nucleic acid-binding protein
MIRLVVDANVVISSLINKGVPFSVFLSNSILRKFEFIAPEFLLEEVRKHKQKILKFTRFSEQEFEEAYDFLIGEITFIPADDFSEFLHEAKKLAPHEKDAPYIALSIAFNCPIFSGDKGLLKREKINTKSPRELLNSIFHK